MLSSRKFFKNTEVVEEKCNKKIETTHTPKKKKIEPTMENHTLSVSDMKQIEHDFYQVQQEKQEKFSLELETIKTNYLNILKKERKKFFHELLRLKEIVLKDADEEGKIVKENAYKIGLKEGQLDGFETGKVDGYQAGLLEAESLKENALSLIEQAKEAMDLYQKEKQDDFIRAAALMAENIINQEISMSDDQLKLLLQPVLNKVEKSDNFITIFVTKEQLENTNDYMENMKQQFPDLKFAVLVDESLEKNGCIIETNYEVIDLQVKKQLEAMIIDLSKEE
ncbi:MAG: FliH/SctL family protein [Vagococcus sp.]|uniref:FliH/SctL family protein n=1 Tax=Vagococcus sp. TaxID=1933889 RepID=UPI002FC8319A